MAKVLLINPVVREEDNPKHVPYGIALLAAIVDQEGHRVQIYDANAWRLGDRELCDAIQADDWDVVATGGITTTYTYVKKLVKYAKQLAPQALVVVGGGLLTSMPRDIMALMPEIDLGAVGEAFVTFPDILRKVDNKDRDWSDVLGVAYRDSNGKIRLTPPRPLKEDIDSLPYPAWDMFPLDNYWENSGLLYSEEAFTSKRRLDINASYGCSLICRFCFHLGISGDMKYVDTPDGPDAIFTYDRNIRWHSARYVVDQVKYARDRFGVDFILFLDENLMTMNAYSGWKWLPEIADLWIKEGLQPQCRREGKTHNSSNCKYGVHWGGTSPHEIGWEKRTPKSDKIERRRCQYERCPSRKIHEGIPPGSSEAGNGREAIIAGGSPPVVPGAIDVRVLGEGTKGRQTGRCRQDVQALD